MKQKNCTEIILFSFSRHFIGRPIQTLKGNVFDPVCIAFFEVVAFFSLVSFVCLFFRSFYFPYTQAHFCVHLPESMCIELASFDQLCHFLCLLFSSLSHSLSLWPLYFPSLPLFLDSIVNSFFTYRLVLFALRQMRTHNCEREPRQYWPKRIAIGECDNEYAADPKSTGENKI